MTAKIIPLPKPLPKHTDEQMLAGISRIVGVDTQTLKDALRGVMK